MKTLKEKMEIFKATHAELIAARKRLKHRQNRGSDEEYIRHQVEVYYKFADLREQANLSVLGYTF